MQHEIIMPALGMAQETGLIIAWHKAAGDAIKASDILLEIETDKSVMEVEAGHDGFVDELLSSAGCNVPVGHVIAVISSERPSGATPPVPSPRVDIPKQVEVVAAPSHGPKKPATPPPSILFSDKILASPKAKRLAEERGLDLRRLLAQGLPQPFRVADLKKITAVTAVGARSEMEARAAIDRLEQFLALVQENSASGASALWAALAAASLRRRANRDLVIRVEEGGRAQDYRNPDHGRLSQMAAVEALPDLTIRDLRATRLIAMRLSIDAGPIMSLADQGGTLSIILSFDADSMAPDEAADLLTTFASFVEDPLRLLI